MRSTVEYRRPSPARVRAKRFLNLLEVVALAMAIFVLVPMVVQAGPGDDIEAQFETPGGNKTLHCQFTGQSVFPDDTVYCRLRVGNGSSVDGSFFLFVEEDSYKVTKCPDQGTPDKMGDDFDPETGECIDGADTRIEVDPSDPDYDTFVGSWALSVESQPVLVRSLPEDRDVRYDDRFVETCPKQGLDAYDAGPGDGDQSQMCDMGLIRHPGHGPNDFGQQVYERQYYIGMTMRNDPDEDQSWSRGWDLHFDFVVRMQVPANDTCPESRVNGICPIPLYERR